MAEWIRATLQIGMPLTAMSWLMFNWLYGAGQLPREAGHKAIREQLDSLRKHHRTSKTRRGNYLYRQWMLFGGGFYGLSVLWTLLVIESMEFVGFIVRFDLQSLLADGVMALLVSFVVAQASNILAALLWFGYWPGANSAIVPWVVMAYAGYLYGIHLARERQTLHHWRDLAREIKHWKSTQGEKTHHDND